MVTVPFLNGGDDLLLKIIISVIILAASWGFVTLIRRGQANKLKKGQFTKFLITKFESIGIYLIGIVIIFWLFDLSAVWIELQITFPIVSKIAKIIILWTVAVFIVRNFNDVYEKFAEKTGKVPHEVSILVQKIATYGIYGVGIVITLGILGLTGAVQGLLVGAGFAGIVIGFAAQDTLGNLFAGVALLLDRPFKIGDWIHLKNQNLVGFVKEISFRSVTLVGPDNTPINIPNAVISRESIVNYTTHKLRRFFLEVGISYESDVGKAIKVITETLSKDPATVKEGIRGQGYFAPIEVVVEKFDNSSVNLTAKVFIDTAAAGGLFVTKSRMLESIKKALTKAKIEIPYPRRVVIMREEK